MSDIMKDSCIVLGVLVGLLVIAVLVVYAPQGQKLDELRASIVTRQLGLSTDATKASIVPQMLQEVEEMKKKYKNFDQRLPQRRELGGFLREISQNMGHSGLADPLIEPGNPSREELFHTLPIIMQFKGSYLSLAEFLKRIDAMERVTRVRRINVAREKKKSGELDIELRMNIYFTES